MANKKRCMALKALAVLNLKNDCVSGGGEESTFVFKEDKETHTEVHSTPSANKDKGATLDEEVSSPPCNNTW